MFQADHTHVPPALLNKGVCVAMLYFAPRQDNRGGRVSMSESITILF